MWSNGITVVYCETPFCADCGSDRLKPLPFQPGGGSSNITEATFCKPSSRMVTVDPGCKITASGWVVLGVVGLIDSFPIVGGRDGFATGGIVGGTVIRNWAVIVGCAAGNVVTLNDDVAVITRNVGR